MLFTFVVNRTIRNGAVITVVINEKNLSLQTKCPLMVIDYWASWCRPCKMMKPVLDRLAIHFKGRIRFGTVDVERHRSLAEKYHVMSIPSLIIFEHGRAHERVTGYYSFSALNHFLGKKLREV